MTWLIIYPLQRLGWWPAPFERFCVPVLVRVDREGSSRVWAWECYCCAPVRECER